MAKIDTFKEIILDFIDNALPDVYKRDIEVPDNTGKIITIIGPRRAGKTFVLFHKIKSLRKLVPKNRIIYINFEDDRLFPIHLQDLDDFIQAYYQLFPDNKKEKVYFFFDEIQIINNWEKFIRRINDQEDCEIFITGSTSSMLSREIATSLRGRTISYEVLPLSFREFLQFRGIEVDPGTSYGKSKLMNEFQIFLFQGGFPELIFIDPVLHLKVINEYLDVMIYKDLIERFAIKNTYLIKYLIKHLFINLSNLLSINKVYNDFKSQGIKVSKDTLYEYKNYLEEVFLIFEVKMYSLSPRVQAVNPSKIYGVDPLFKLSQSINVDKGRLFENAVYLEMRRKGIAPDYLVVENQEIDFFWKDRYLLNVTYDLSDYSTREREIKGLQKAMKAYSITEAEIITYGHKETIIENGKTIKVRPAIEYSLY